MGRRGLHLLVAVEFFPSRIQPWLLNTIEEAVKRGADVEIGASRSSGSSFPPKAESLGLIGRTSYFPSHSRPAILSGLRRFLPGHRDFVKAWRGLRQISQSADFRPKELSAWIGAINRSSLVGGRRFDLVHAHYLTTAYQYLAVPAVFQCPLIVTFHGLSPVGVGMLSPARNLEVFERGRFFLVNTQFAKKQLESLGCPGDKIRVLPQGLRIEEHAFVPRSFPTAGPIRVLTVARFHPDKGHCYAIEAIGKLVARGHDVEYRLVGVGEEKENLIALARQLGIHHRIKFVGQLDDAGLAEEYASAHIFVLPSVRDRVGHHEETQGAVIQEAQASGAVVVATLTGGIPECVDDGRSAFLVPDRNAEALANKIAWVISQHEQWPVWQRQARQWVEKHFDMQVVGDRLWNIYWEAIETSARSSPD